MDILIDKLAEESTRRMGLYSRLDSRAVPPDGRQREDPEVLNRYLEKANVFIILSSSPTVLNETLNKDDVEDLDLPFPVVYLQYFNTTTGNGMGFLTSARNSSGENFMTQSCGILVCEIGPKQYCSYVLFRESVNGELIGRYQIGLTQDNVFAAKFLIGLKNAKASTDKVKIKMRLGNGDNRRPHIIKKVVLLKPKNEVVTKSPLTGAVVVWSHRWEVRGHWREMPGCVGKDRDGQMKVGWTWVKNHIKGPDNLPLIQKIRVKSDTLKNNSSLPLDDSI